MEKSIDRVMDAVRYYIRQSLKITAIWHSYSLAQESYSRWAARELLVRLETNRTVPPLVIIEEFRDQMDDYSYNSCVFLCAKDLADCIIDLLIT